MGQLAHELRNPLNSLLGNLEIMENLSKENEDKRVLGLHSAHQILAVINSLQQYNSFQAAGHVFVNERVPCSFFLQSLITQYRSLITSLDMDFDCSFLPGEFPSELIIPKEPVLRVLFALVSNVVRFSQEGDTKISVSVRCSVQRQKRRKLVFVVQGNSLLTETLDPDIFSPFSPSGSDTKRFGGSGFWLYMSLEVIRALKGELILEPSNPLTFRIELPFETDEQVTWSTLPPTLNQSLPSDNGPQTEAEALKFLVVDDNSLNRQVLLAMLKKIEHPNETKSASGGKEAVSLAKKFKFDVIFMDLAMPEMDGHEAAEAIRKFDPQVYIVCLTGHSTDSEQQRALKTMNEFISKPLSLSVLSEIIARCHQRQRLSCKE